MTIIFIKSWKVIQTPKVEGYFPFKRGNLSCFLYWHLGKKRWYRIYFSIHFCFTRSTSYFLTGGSSKLIYLGFLLYNYFSFFIFISIILGLLFGSHVKKDWQSVYFLFFETKGDNYYLTWSKPFFNLYSLLLDFFNSIYATLLYKNLGVFLIPSLSIG